MHFLLNVLYFTNILFHIFVIYLLIILFIINIYDKYVLNLHFQYSFVASKMVMSLKCVGRLQWLVLNSWENELENAPPHEMPPDQSCFLTSKPRHRCCALEQALNPEWLQWEPSAEC